MILGYEQSRTYNESCEPKLKTLRFLLTSMFVFFCFLPPCFSQGSVDENEIKAVFIYNFLKYTTWPEEKAGKHSMKIMVIHHHELFLELKKLAQDKVLNGRTIEVSEEAPKWEEVEVIYFGSEGTMNKQLRNGIKSYPILTISDTANANAMIRFFQEDQKMRFEINMKEVEEANLKLSSQLLKVAKVVP